MLLDDEVPKAITIELLNSTNDDELEELLYHYTRVVLNEHGCFTLSGPSDRDVLQELPRGLRLAWTLVAVDWEVGNGGFFQWFTNSSGQCADLTVEDLRLIGAERQLALVEEAIALDNELGAKHPDYANRWECPRPERYAESEAAFWSCYESTFEPEYDRLSSAWYELEETDSIWPTFIAWLRQHPALCVHSR